METPTKEETKSPKYDPNKNYQWRSDSHFLLTSKEFGTILNSLRMVLNTPEAQNILLADRAAKAIENALARAVEVGEAVEMEDNKK